MSYAEQTAYKLYEEMHLNTLDEDVKRCLIGLLTTTPKIPNTLEEAMSMGAMDLETAREELHAYIDELAKEYDLR